MKIEYFSAIRTAGYSGFVGYFAIVNSPVLPCNVSYWMIPGTFEDDWDCRQ